ncbi:MAG: hypothetical protein R3A13_00705 [Bdellovibrionota bacterium]
MKTSEIKPQTNSKSKAISQASRTSELSELADSRNEAVSTQAPKKQAFDSGRGQIVNYSA